MTVTATVVAMAAGMIGPASASETAPATATAGKASGNPDVTTADLAGTHRITLITGDRVVVDAKGRFVGMERAEGREHIAVRTRTVAAHTFVVPADAARLIAIGKLDRRLFDVTELNKAATRKDQQQGLKLIVGYKSSVTAAKADVRSAGKLRRTLPSLNADAITTPRQDAADLWAAVAGDSRTASGIAHIWLDSVRRASLDRSVPQIGAPKAWKAGYDGQGVRIAVLDTGVDATHPDLEDQVIESKNFSTAADPTDHFGHGTHVASIAAGTGVKSGGAYKGVAPGAKILSGKVLDDTGYGDDSSIIAGMEWAAEQGADVVNLSLGGGDTPGVDPVEAEINKLSASKGILFTVAAGNNGPDSLGSPGSADAALTVGAVDDNDRLADFSSTGPRDGDGAIKPDVTAPGVDITAAAAPGSVIEQEVGQNPEGYLTISGTSMATPHVAGAAAILKQQHPDWTYAELKGVLTGSAKGGAYTPFQQGSGRIAVDRAIEQTVIADPVSLNFGTALWPHTDDRPVTRQLTYRNLGRTDVTLDLAVTGTGPQGEPAPDGFFTLGARTVTVPAGGTASVGLTADTVLGGSTDGAYSAYVVANGDDGHQSVRTAAVVQREAEAHDVTLKFVGRDGRPTPDYSTFLLGVSGLGGGSYHEPYDASGTVELRLYKGTYLLDSTLSVDPEDSEKGTDWLVRPKLDVTDDMTVTVDARTARPVDITVPDSAAELRWVAPRYWYAGEGYNIETGVDVNSFASLRTAHLGPPVTTGSLNQQWIGSWTKGADTEYDVFLGGNTQRLATGYRKHLDAGDLATVKVGLGSSSSTGRTGGLTAAGFFPELGGLAPLPRAQNLPRTRTLHLSTLDHATWGLYFDQYGAEDENGDAALEGFYTLGEPQSFKPGRSYTKTFNTGVLGPRLTTTQGLFRDGDTITADLPLHADGRNHDGWTTYSSARTTLYRNGTKIDENDDPLSGNSAFTVPSDDAEYRLTSSVRRAPETGRASSRVDTTWTFRSGHTDGPTQLPASTVHFDAPVDLRSQAPADREVSLPVIVQGAAKGANLKSLSVYVSYDHGDTWKRTPVEAGRITVNNPAKGKAISLRAEITDRQGNRSSVSIYDAYFGK